MAWYYGRYSCGHEGRVNIIGPGKDREWKKERAFGGLCPECYKKKFDEEMRKRNIEAAKKTSEMELPELSGSEKQIVWANTLRMQVIKRYENQSEEFSKIIEEEKKYLEKLEKEGNPNNKTLRDEKLFLFNKEDKKIRTSIEELSDSLDYAIKKYTSAKFWIESRFNREILADLCPILFSICQNKDGMMLKYVKISEWI